MFFFSLCFSKLSNGQSRIVLTKQQWESEKKRLIKRKAAVFLAAIITTAGKWSFMDQNKESRLVEHDSVHFRIKGGWHILKWNVTHSISEVGNCDRSYGKKNMIRHYKVIDKMRKSFFFFLVWTVFVFRSWQWFASTAQTRRNVQRLLSNKISLLLFFSCCARVLPFMYSRWVK